MFAVHNAGGPRLSSLYGPPCPPCGPLPLFARGALSCVPFCVRLHSLYTNCLKEKFCELRPNGVLRTSPVRASPKFALRGSVRQRTVHVDSRIHYRSVLRESYSLSNAEGSKNLTVWAVRNTDGRWRIRPVARWDDTGRRTRCRGSIIEGCCAPRMGASSGSRPWSCSLT